MEKSILVILVALLMAGCGAKSSDASSQTTESQESKPSTSAVTPKSDGNVLHRVEQIYKEVAAEYAKYDEDFESMDDDGLDDRFCSDEWKGLVAKVVDFDSTNNPDEIGFFDADYWVMGQDSQDLSASDFNLVEEKGDKAIVEFNLHNCGSITKVRLEMVRERGDWFIDNFIDLDNAINWKEEMKDYLK
ncbi:MAG: DUF3828 domain-containing protein [Prevotella sp.]|nr:DUF3828 domain-containing protein [Prevotella sp.]